MTFNNVMKMGNWMLIRNCPGRFALHDVSPMLSLRDLLGDGVSAQQSYSPKAKDTVWIAQIEDGGIISYSRPDGSWLHTLNTAEGFERKLKQLEIDVGERTT
jgi:hypothetical protein